MHLFLCKGPVGNLQWDVKVVSLHVVALSRVCSEFARFRTRNAETSRCRMQQVRVNPNRLSEKCHPQSERRLFDPRAKRISMQPSFETPFGAACKQNKKQSH